MALEFTVRSRDATLAGEDSGEGPPVVLLHGLTATRRYVVMGSRSLERSGHRVIAYDARGHGQSDGGTDVYTYDLLAEDLERVMDGRGVDRAVLAGVSMGAHTLVNFALRRPNRVAGLVVITPAYDGSIRDLEHWAALAAGLRRGGIDGFLGVYDLDRVDPKLRGTVETVIRQRMSRHRDLTEVARALEQVPGSRPFGQITDLGATTAPTIVIASSDGPDPEHPQRVGEAYAATIPGARLITDPVGASPVAWQGSQVSRVIADVVAGGASGG